MQHTLKVLATKSTPSDNSYDCLASALYTAAEKLLPKRARSDPQWFQKNSLILRGKIEVRNRMFDEYYQRNPRCASIKMKLQRSRRALQQAVRKAKDDWIIMQTDRVNDGVCGATGSKVAWDAVKTLKRGLELKRRPALIRMKFIDGSSASTAETMRRFSPGTLMVYMVAERFMMILYFFLFLRGHTLKDLKTSPRTLKSPWR